jgi:dCTP diphosphatase
MFPEFTEEEKNHIGQEMSDVLIYLVRLADRCDIDLPSAVLQKFELNRQKYPAQQVYGKSDKYTAYK